MSWNLIDKITEIGDEKNAKIGGKTANGMARSATKCKENCKVIGACKVHCKVDKECCSGNCVDDLGTFYFCSP